eukprot:Phypoly_transcript_22055.p1 GENE.Phypoly_transcript_22055~~Phypoly_transcript_22055.p1  ORF type:complete len:158 (+),score=26.60 Phypoly_transcript_22055:122-595(+)
MTVSIRSFNKDSATDLSAFQAITNQWITPLMEDVDRKIIGDPYGVIVDELGGYLFVAEDTTKSSPSVVGVVGLVKVSTDVYEMVKLGVAQTSQGKGVGKKLSMHCIEKARELNAKKLELESHSSLQAAIRIYESLGFVKIDSPLHYITADLKMELCL